MARESAPDPIPQTTSSRRLLVDDSTNSVQRHGLNLNLNSSSRVTLKN